MIHIHDLHGCAPTPLAHYLKALGVLRLVSEQADPLARGWWEGECFRLATTLSADELREYFLRRYEPTPLVSPWNNGSGFYPKDKKSRRAHDAIVDAGAPRLARFAEAIREARALVAGRTEAPAKGSGKETFIAECRNHWRGGAQLWLEAALAIDHHGALGFPALLGSGGNDGRFDFASNFVIRLSSVVGADGRPTPRADAMLRNALWAEPAPGLLTGAQGKVGQFLPGGAGGANSVNGPGDQDDTLLNPWDFVLLLEGCLLLSSSVVKRLGAPGGSQASAPFVTTSRGAGYASSSDADESASGEQWMPLWLQPLGLAECRRLFAEGRVQIGRSTARQSLDMARAVARLGAARGIGAFQRFGYVERNGQSNFAVPLARLRVPNHVAPQLACLDDIAAWAAQVHRQAAGADGTAGLRQVSRGLADAFFDATRRPEHAQTWQTLLLRAVAVEAVMKGGAGFRAQPIPPLRPQWVEAADDGSAGFRLALSLALQARAFRHGTFSPVDPVRRHWLPLDTGRARPRFATTGDALHLRLDKRTDIVMHGRNGIDDAIALVERRIVEGAQFDASHFDLHPAPRAGAALADLSAWLQGRVDSDRTLALARALMALDHGSWAEQRVCHGRADDDGEMPDDAWLCIRLAHLPWPLPDGRRVPCDPAIVRRLAADDAAGALQLALRRLRASGIRPALRAGAVPAATARRWAAALAFPITRTTAGRIVARIDNHFAQEHLA